MTVAFIMPFVFSILAAGDDDVAKIIFGVVVAVIWVVASVVSALSKQKKKEPSQPERSWEDVLRDLSGESSRPEAPPAPPRAEPPPIPLPPRPPQEVPQRRRPQQHRPARPPRPPRVRQAEPVAVPARHISIPTAPPMSSAGAQTTIGDVAQIKDVITSTEIGSPQDVSNSQPNATARSVRRWLMPSTLRSEFILTEILQPPLALRPPPQERP